MTERTSITGQALLALVGPLIWAAHFFSVYLAEAVLCSPSVSAENSVQVAGGILTAIAVIALLWSRRISRQRAWSRFARPLIDLSIVAVMLTTIPLLMIGACRSAGA